MPTLRDQILALPPGQRAAKKADILQKAAAVLTKIGSYTFTHDGYTVTISEPVLFLPDGFQLTVTATLGGVEVPVNNPYRWVNPPVLLRDANGDYVEDLPLLIKTLIVDAVRVT